jgi:hypothetical protein
MALFKILFDLFFPTERPHKALGCATQAEEYGTQTIAVVKNICYNPGN